MLRPRPCFDRWMDTPASTTSRHPTNGRHLKQRNLRRTHWKSNLPSALVPISRCGFHPIASERETATRCTPARKRWHRQTRPRGPRHGIRRMGRDGLQRKTNTRPYPAGQRSRVLRDDRGGVQLRTSADRVQEVRRKPDVGHFLADDAFDSPVHVKVGAGRSVVIHNRPDRTQIGRNRGKFEFNRALQHLFEPRGVTRSFLRRKQSCDGFPSAEPSTCIIHTVDSCDLPILTIRSMDNQSRSIEQSSQSANPSRIRRIRSFLLACVPNLRRHPRREAP